MIKRLNPKHLKKLLNNECDIILYQDGLSEEGEPLPFFKLEKQKCRFVEKTKTIISSDGKKVELVGKVIISGDISVIPERELTVEEVNKLSVKDINAKSIELKSELIKINRITGGIVKIYESEYRIFQASKPRNPDGSVHHTTLELI